MNKTGIKLQKVIDKNAKLLNMKLLKRKDYPFALSEVEDYQLTTVLSNELFSWELQMTIGITKEGLIHMMLFMHPVIIKEKNRLSFIQFVNAANMWLGSEFGRFLVNNDNDYCYECYLPQQLLDNPVELEKQLFDRPFSHFMDSLTPLMQLKTGEWTVDRAIEYLDELREKGYIDNSEYGIW